MIVSDGLKETLRNYQKFAPEIIFILHRVMIFPALAGFSHHWMDFHDELPPLRRGSHRFSQIDRHRLMQKKRENQSKSSGNPALSIWKMLLNAAKILPMQGKY